ncbi:MAG: hypothetical protein QOJ12_3538 [Thermoleophilales bacterium]|jgi:hypothetical protein|nr:hypothetical protein [Thermoleophilales bacterium]
MPTPVVVEGYFVCPAAFAIETNGLAGQYQARIGDRDTTITLPRIDENASPFQPRLLAPHWYYQGISIPQADIPSDEAYWGNGAIFNADNTPRVVIVRRIRIAVDEVVGDTDKRRTADLVARAMPRWWGLASTWIEIIHGQDLSRLGPIAPGVHFNGTTLWTQLERDAALSQVTYVGAQPGRYSMPNYAPMSPNDFQYCLDLASNGSQPADAWLFIRDARSLLSGHDYRRAVLDAGVAAELALTTLIRLNRCSQGIDEDEFEHELQRRQYRTLGGRCSYWENHCGGELPDDYRSQLIDTRNAATHEGLAVSRSAAEAAIAVATEIVVTAHPLS